jgi:hypothetical protein
MHKNERVLEFKYFNRENASKLETLLRGNKVDYVAYWEHLYMLFKVRKGDKMWSELQRLINTIKAPKYSYTYTCIDKGQEYLLINI